MLLAGDVGGTKTLLGLFEEARHRPRAVEIRSYQTDAFTSFVEILHAFSQELRRPLLVRAATFGVAGPVVHDHARLTNVPWEIGAEDIRQYLGVQHVRLLNDLEALAHGVELLTADEVVTLQEGVQDPEASAAVIAAGTGLGQAYLRRLNGRLVPSPSEGGHADFAARSDRELELVRMLRDRFGRAEVEHVLSGPGLVNVHQFTHRGGECTIGTDLDSPDAPAEISRAGLAGRCQGCAEALRMFVSAYGAESGNLALRGLALAGLYIGGGIAPKILPAITNGEFMESFLAKEPMRDLLAKVPVKVILNAQAGLLGAAARAGQLVA